MSQNAVEILEREIAAQEKRNCDVGLLAIVEHLKEQMRLKELKYQEAMSLIGRYNREHDSVIAATISFMEQGPCECDLCKEAKTI